MEYKLSDNLFFTPISKISLLNLLKVPKNKYFSNRPQKYLYKQILFSKFTLKIKLRTYKIYIKFNTFLPIN